MRSILLSFLFVSGFCCKQKEAVPENNNCKGSPPFVKHVAGFNTGKSYFSTSEIRKMGLVLVENQGPESKQPIRYYQHPSWQKAGWLSPIQIDENGNIYTAPAPFINVLDNPVEKQNTIYKIDAIKGEMNEFIKLPQPDSLNNNNPYGVLGLTYLCNPGVLYASTIAGSNRYTEQGAIYAIDIKSAKIKDRISGIDAMGMGITSIRGQKELFFGTGRSPAVFSVSLGNDGRFKSKPVTEFSLEGLGPRGDDKVRRIRTDQDGNLIIYGIEFNYNLIAPREKPETVYEFFYDANQKKWVCKYIHS